jgi:hypothetical protein
LRGVGLVAIDGVLVLRRVAYTRQAVPPILRFPSRASSVSVTTTESQQAEISQLFFGQTLSGVVFTQPRAGGQRDGG